MCCTPHPIFLEVPHGVFHCTVYTNGGSLCQAFLAETMETGTKNHFVIEAPHVLGRKLRKQIKFRTFPKNVGPRVLSLESTDYFGTSEHY